MSCHLSSKRQSPASRAADGARLLAWSAVSTALLFALAAVVHHRRITRGTGSSIWQRPRGTLRFRTPATGIGQMYFRGHDILLGKTIGLSKYMTLQLGVSMIPLLALPRPDIGQVLAGLSAGLAGAVVAAGFGQLLSVRFPRRFSESGLGSSLPLYLSWIPIAAIGGLGAVFVGILAIGEATADGAGAGLLVPTAIVFCLAYRAALPRFGAWMMENRERLLSM